MPQTIPADRAGTTRSAEDEFLDLICSDDEFVQAEFDAIIAAEWPSPPPNRPRRDTPGGQHPGRGHQYPEPAAQDGLPLRPRPPGVEAWSRQRSPPKPTDRLQARKAGDAPRDTPSTR